MIKEIVKKPFYRTMCLFGTLCGRLFEKPFHKKEIKKILIFQIGGIGDVLGIFPVIKALSDAFPEAAIATLSEFGDELFDLFPYSRINVKKYRYEPRGRHKSIGKKLTFFRAIKRDGFDLVYNSNRGVGMIEASVMAFLIGAPHRLGFEKNGAGFLNTIRVEFRYDQYILEQNFNLLKKIHVEAEEKDVRIRIPEKDKMFLSIFLKEYAISNEKLFITVHPGAKYYGQLKMWPLEKYSTLIKEILSLYKATIILIGNETERIFATEISSKVQSPDLINTMGKTTITQMAALIANSDLFIGNDSGPLHLAAALRVPSIGIFGFTAPEQVIPVHQKHITVIKARGKPAYIHQPFLQLHQDDTNALSQISVEEVLEAVHKTLTGRKE